MDKFKIIICLLFLFSFLSVTSISALTYPQDTDFIFSIPCKFNNTACPSDTACTFGLVSPNSSIIYNNVSMTLIKQLATYNVSQQHLIGDYPYTVDCIEGGLMGSTSSYFHIGQVVSTSEGLFYVLILILSAFVFGFFVMGFFKIKFKNTMNIMEQKYEVAWTKYWKVACFFMAYMTLTWIFFISDIIGRRFLAVDFISVFSWNMFSILMWGLVAIIPLGFFIMLLLLLTDIKLKKLIERNLEPR
jgi:hypothetical protein